MKEGGIEGEREGGRDARRERWRERWREVGREGWREVGWEGGRLLLVSPEVMPGGLPTGPAQELTDWSEPAAGPLAPAQVLDAPEVGASGLRVRLGQD